MEGNMTILQLRQFCMVAELESITDAAAKLFITQPALSLAIKKIENELDVVLFERRGRYIQLSEKGKIVYRHANSILSQWDTMNEEIILSKDKGEMLKIGYTTRYVSDYMLPLFIVNNPGTQMSMNEMREETTLSSLQYGIYDVVISNRISKVPEDSDIICKKIYTTRMMVSVPISNPLSRMESLTIKDLDGQKFIRLNKNGMFTNQVSEEQKLYSVNLICVQRVNYEVIKILQNHCDYLYFITSIQAENDYVPPDRRLIPVKGPSFQQDLYATYQAGSAQKIAPFMDWVDKRWANSLNKDG